MHYFVEFCRDRRLRTFLKVVQTNLQHTCSKRGGGVKGRLNNVKKNAQLVLDGFPKSDCKVHKLVVCLSSEFGFSSSDSL